MSESGLHQWFQNAKTRLRYVYIQTPFFEFLTANICKKIMLDRAKQKKDKQKGILSRIRGASKPHISRVSKCKNRV